MIIYSFDELTEATFIRRLNKFLVEVDLKGKIKCHLHDPGRLQQLLKRGRKVLLCKKEGRKRKTKYDVIAIKLKEWVFIHSGYHSIFAEKILENGLLKNFNYKIEKKEYKYGKSRIDFLLKNSKKCLLEVKGSTYEKNGIAMFPDAPTERGRRHVVELINAINNYKVAILFLVMREARYFSPNWEIDEKFSQTLKMAHERGVKIMACRIKFDGKNVYFGKEIPVRL